MHTKKEAVLSVGTREASIFAGNSAKKECKLVSLRLVSFFTSKLTSSFFRIKKKQRLVSETLIRVASVSFGTR